ncbi:zinc ribbon domain-containing protein [Ruminococcus flavefaciens]|jgi:DNA-directed RNA polymerase subunit RPC12/RpoP|uniref:zinc ribbon domain-containing protein n=1 Tax=Ruminococcus flavefaciens TaxID=1265 RepID=UPI0026EDBF7B|nr:zinc ribbon domain-containing protein [Ruminococcus flavefaciens]
MGFVDSVKDFAEKVGESVERGAKTVSTSSKRFAEKTKIRREMARVESDINTDYIELGKVMYEKICSDPDTEYMATISDIKEKTLKLDELKAELMSLEDKVFCENCGSQIRREQVYCDKCGAKVIHDAPAEEAEEAPNITVE